MASRIGQLAAALAAGLLGKPVTRGAITPATTVLPVDKDGKSLTSEALEAALKATTPGGAATVDFVSALTSGDDLGPLGGAIFKGLAAAAPGLLLLPAMAGITGEVAFMRPLRKHFSPAMLSGIEIIEGYRRGQFTREEADAKLAETGLSDEDRAALFKITESLPTATDIIRFAVKEVYTPSIREEFKLDQGADEVVRLAESDLKAAGVSEDTLRKFWAAHWELPSVTQGFEMFQRGIITEAQLDLLLRALDISPFWRDKLKLLSYQPLTRVDVRRMYKLGVLDDKAVIKAYRDVGYSPENAELLLEFTKQSAGDPEAGEETFSDREAKTQRDLSKTDIIEGLLDGLVSDTQAMTGLSVLGYTQAEATFLIAHARQQDNAARAKEVVKSVKTGFIGGVFAESQAIAELTKVGYSATVIKELTDTWKLELATKTVMPTRADILRWLKGERITRQQAEDALSRLGIPDQFAELYIDENLPAAKDAA